MRRFLLGVFLLGELRAAAGTGAIRGTVVDGVTRQPAEYVAVALKASADGALILSTATDAKGVFAFDGVPDGSYQLTYGLVGAEHPQVTSATLNPAHRSVEIGPLPLAADSVVKLEKVEVSARQEAFYNSIDRKVYNVGKDIQSATGSASDLLKNVPSVQVDIEGNVSLRGDPNVLILINGKTSTMMGSNRAEMLEQMAADGIEKIEVITNPSAKYKPDGTAGIINLTLKKKMEPGYSGSVRGSAGNAGRYNSSVSGNFNPGRFNLSGSASYRQDDRSRTGSDDRSHPDPVTHAIISTSQRTTEHAAPITKAAQGGVDFKIDQHSKVGAQLNYHRHDFFRESTVTSVTRNGSGGPVTEDYDRIRTDPEFTKSLEGTGTFEHRFAEEDRELAMEVKRDSQTQIEDNRYENVFRIPVRAPSRDNTLLRTDENGTELSADYTHPLDENSKLEAGYSWELNRVDVDFRGNVLDPITNTLVVDPVTTNRFLYEDRIHAGYLTYARKIHRFGALAGLRFEQATVDTDQVTTRITGHHSYARWYPSLHTSYDLTDSQQLQLNYSHRVHRPDGSDLNPFPKYQDPFNIRAGNPRLVPEDIHSVEAGWQYKKDDTTYLASVYYRYRYHSMTEVARYIDATTLLTTRENLGTNQSSGLELGATTRLKERLSLNFSSNVYRSEIDARNLGFNQRRAALAWDAKLNAGWDLTKSTLMQLNTNYTARRLTPQGYRYPTYVANVGVRHNLKNRKTSLVLSVSDLFNSVRENTHIDTPALQQEIVRRRSARIVMLGFIYNFGKPAKKPKNDLQFDPSL